MQFSSGETIIIQGVLGFIDVATPAPGAPVVVGPTPLQWVWGPGNRLLLAVQPALCIDTQGPGGPLFLNHVTGSSTQSWVSRSPFILNAASGTAITSHGSLLLLMPVNGSPYQQWRLVPAGLEALIARNAAAQALGAGLQM